MVITYSRHKGRNLKLVLVDYQRKNLFIYLFGYEVHVKIKNVELNFQSQIKNKTKQ